MATAYTDNLDPDFYIKMYPDILLNKKTNNVHHYDIIAKNHWLKYGKKEGRVCNQQQMMTKYTTTLKAENDKNNSFVPKKIYQKKLNILIRTHLRPKEFEKCLNSVLSQTYSNYHIYVSYDDMECLSYLEKYTNNSKITVVFVRKESENECFFDLYNNKLMGLVKNGYILFLDDDKYFINDKCFQIINHYVDINSILIWKLLQADKIVYPTIDTDIKYGDIDTCSFCFNQIHKVNVMWKDTYGSDYYFFEELKAANNLSLTMIDYTLVSVYDLTKINNYKTYINNPNEILQPYLNKFTDVNRIDFCDYLDYYSDLKLKNNTPSYAKRHWIKYGRHESRTVKIFDFDYDLFLHSIQFQYEQDIEPNIHLVICLYNEYNIIRQREYEISLNHNLNNPHIKKITLFYDRTNGCNNSFLNTYEDNPKINILYKDSGRPNIHEMLLLEEEMTREITVIANADIIFDDSIKKLNAFDDASFVALTRWEFINETETIPRLKFSKIFSESKDVWAFYKQSAVQNIDVNLFKDVYVGTWACDGKIKDIVTNSACTYIDECLNIKSYHVHFCNERKYQNE